MPMGDDGSWMPDFRAALKPGWVPDFRQALTPEWIQGIREVLGADGQGQPRTVRTPGRSPTSGARWVLGGPGRTLTGHPGRSRDDRPQADGMPDFHGLLGGAGGSFTSDEWMAAMNSRQADPTSKDDERRNVVLDLGRRRRIGRGPEHQSRQAEKGG